MKVDLHLHTNLSDGLYDPEQVVSLATAAGLTHIGITDHDTISGCSRTLEAAPEGLTVIPGVEISCTWRDGSLRPPQWEVHILGFFPRGFSQALKSFLRRAQDERRLRVAEALRRLARIGVRLSMEQLERIARGDSLSRTHLARVMVEKGYARNLPDAFRRYLDYKLGCVPRTSNTVAAAIEVIRSSGGIAVWAHPTFDIFDASLRKFMDMGLDGVESYNCRKDTIHFYYYESVTEHLGLVSTVGSDWHGFRSERQLQRLDFDSRPLERFFEMVSCYRTEACGERLSGSGRAGG
jgi:hypothetical protein